MKLPTNTLISNVRRKLRATRAIWTAKGISETVPIKPDDEVRILIDMILRKRLKVDSSSDGLTIKTVADEILAGMKQIEARPYNARLETLLDGATSQAFWFHSQLGAITTMWEFRVRLFGVKIGIHPNVAADEKSKKNKALGSVEHRLLSDTIKEINKKTGGRLKLKLLELAELRNAVVHCNPQGTIAHAVPFFGKEVLKPVRGNVILINLPDFEAKNMSDMKDEHEVERQDVFGWFLELFASELPEKLFSAFEDSIKALDEFTEFAAVSFDDRKGVFDRLVFQGIAPTPEDVDLYEVYYVSKYAHRPRSSEETRAFLAGVVALFKV